MEEYLKQFSQMEAGKRGKTLGLVQNFERRPFIRSVWAENVAVKRGLSFDDAKQRLHFADTGSFYLYSDITLTLVDYLKYLTSRSALGNHTP